MLGFIKPLMISLMFLSISTINAFAEIIPMEQDALNMNLKYPLVYVDNQEAQKKINTDIASWVLENKSTYESGRIYKITTDYKVMYQDDNFLSLRLSTILYNTGGMPRGYSDYIVFDKRTGQKLPIQYFINFQQKDISHYVNIGLIKYRKIDKGGYYDLAPNAQKYYEIPKLDYSYFLDGTGNITYRWGSGIMSFELYFPLESIDYINRLNN